MLVIIRNRENSLSRLFVTVTERVKTLADAIGHLIEGEQVS